MRRSSYSSRSDDPVVALPAHADVHRLCPLCHRPMVPGISVDEHHWTPKSQGGESKQLIHRVCHQKLHSLWTVQELAMVYNTPERARSASEIADFLRWIARKPPEFNVRHARASRKDRR